VHLKLDELLRATRSARNMLVDLEDMSEEEIDELDSQFKRVHQIACEESDAGASQRRDERVANLLKPKEKKAGV
jgi:low affinity Fe/Cu permease